MDLSNKKCIELTDNNQAKSYFKNINHILEKVKQIAEGDNGESTSILHAVIKIHLEPLMNSFKAMELKYRFLGLSNKNNQRLYVDVIDSGFPLEKEIHNIAAHIPVVEEKLSSMKTATEIREDILDYAISEEMINTDFQYMLSKRMYYEFIKEHKSNLFLPLNGPVIESISEEDNEYVVHWSTYDPVKNYPIVYIMYCKIVDAGNSELKRMFDKIRSSSISSILLLNIAVEIDNACPNIHPKKVSRIRLGPIYKNSITENNDAVTEVLEGIEGEELDWIFCLTTESLHSKREKIIKRGIFSEQTSQIFELNSGCLDASEAKVTSLEQRMLMPYDVFQRLCEIPESSLHQHKKFVVTDSDILQF